VALAGESNRAGWLLKTEAEPLAAAISGDAIVTASAAAIAALSKQDL
jgi:hypothetical protein